MSVGITRKLPRSRLQGVSRDRCMITHCDAAEALSPVSTSRHKLAGEMATVAADRLYADALPTGRDDEAARGAAAEGCFGAEWRCCYIYAALGITRL